MSMQRRKKNLQFSESLRNRKLLSMLYGGLSRKYLKNLKVKASKSKRYSSPSLSKTILLFLEMRLDSCVFRMNFFSSFLQARQFIKNGSVFVNGICIRSGCYEVEPGDRISLSCKTIKGFIRERIKQNFLQRKIRAMKPSHIEINYKILQGIVLFPPQQIYYPSPFQVPRRKLEQKNRIDRKWYLLDQNQKYTVAGELINKRLPLNGNTKVKKNLFKSKNQKEKVILRTKASRMKRNLWDRKREKVFTVPRTWEKGKRIVTIKKDIKQRQAKASRRLLLIRYKKGRRIQRSRLRKSRKFRIIGKFESSESSGKSITTKYRKNRKKVCKIWGNFLQSSRKKRFPFFSPRIATLSVTNI